MTLQWTRPHVSGKAPKHQRHQGGVPLFSPFCTSHAGCSTRPSPWREGATMVVVHRSSLVFGPWLDQPFPSRCSPCRGHRHHLPAISPHHPALLHQLPSHDAGACRCRASCSACALTSAFSVLLGSCALTSASCVHLRGSCALTSASCVRLRGSCALTSASCVHLRGFCALFCRLG